MKIGLIGYGKMGKAVEKLACARGDTVLLGISSPVDVFIDFTGPTAVLTTAEALKNRGIPWVLGTTGWDPDQVFPVVKQGNIPFLYGPNFSMGMAIYSRLVQVGARLITKDFSMHGVETHHKEKKDAPSGTARKLMQDIEGLCFESIREGDHLGRHAVIFESAEDKIELVHSAKSRKGFAQGALCAAEWMIKKKGIYTFDEYLETLWHSK